MQTDRFGGERLIRNEPSINWLNVTRMRLHNRLTINYEMANLTATAIGPTADAVCIIWTVRQCNVHPLALWHSWHWTLHSPPVRLPVWGWAQSVCQLEQPKSMTKLIYVRLAIVFKWIAIGGGKGDTFRWAGPFAYRNDLLANDKCG